MLVLASDAGKLERDSDLAGGRIVALMARPSRRRHTLKHTAGTSLSAFVRAKRTLDSPLHL